MDDIGGYITSISYTFAKSNRILAERVADEGVIVWHCDEPQFATLLELNRRLSDGFKMKPVSEVELNKRLRVAYETDSRTAATQVNEEIGDVLDLNAIADEIPQTTDLLDDSNDAPIIRLINAIITQAIKEKSSDVHLEVFEDKSTVRYRIDGLLQDALPLKRELHNALISRLKVMSQLDIAERRLPQDGRMSVRIGQQAIDVRVSILPTQHGERAVLRLLEKQSDHLNLEYLGMPAKLREQFADLTHKPNGIILVVGPTGSGKTTTLYSALNDLDSDILNILTVEDPVEYDLPNIGQTQINNKVGLTFAGGLRSILRQDPDVVLVGEIRDLETAEIAIQASLTGHTVFSTLHTNSAVGALTRLLDMGIEPFLIASSLLGVLSQRLVRQLCAHCKTERALEAPEIEVFHANGLEPPKIMTVTEGCVKCKHNGFVGRKGIYELISIDKETQHLIHNNASELQIEEHVRLVHPPLIQAGLITVMNGTTSIDEVLRVAQSN